jgi:hypothetical protein
MQVEIDLGQGYVDMGTQQMLSVPYALSASQSEYAQNAQLAENAMNGFSGISETGDTLHFSNGNYIIFN